MTPLAPSSITAFASSPDEGQGLARDMRVRWALEEVGQGVETPVEPEQPGDVQAQLKVRRVLSRLRLEVRDAADEHTVILDGHREPPEVGSGRERIRGCRPRPPEGTSSAASSEPRWIGIGQSS
mgnify:CR=1 FL=1